MWHTIFITVHAVAGAVAFVAGCVTLHRATLFRLFLWSVVAMAVSLALALAATWSDVDVTARALFSALAVLAGVMVWRAARARRLRPAGGARPPLAYLDHVGFNLVALFDAFVVVTVLNLGAPGWLVAATGAAIAVAGHLLIQADKRRVSRHAAAHPVSSAAPVGRSDAALSTNNEE